MKGTTHLMIGLAAGAYLAQGQPGLEAAGIIGAAALGALLPDLDSRHAILSRRMGVLHWPLRILPHRGVTHSFLALLGVMILSVPYGVIGIALSVGYCSHLIADSLTGQGIPLAWPAPFRLHMLPGPLAIRTGGMVDSVIAMGAGAVVLLWLWSLLTG